jgi:hypothetical protein
MRLEPFGIALRERDWETVVGLKREEKAPARGRSIQRRRERTNGKDRSDKRKELGMECGETAVISIEEKKGGSERRNDLGWGIQDQ